MKKILFLVAFLFSVVCYASPPPDLTPLADVPDIGCQVYADAAVTVAPVVYEVQEVTFVYRGDYQFTEVPQFAEMTTGTEVPPMLVLAINYSTYSLEEDLPPLNRASHVVTYNYNRDLQFSNYGYPISMN